MPKYSFKRNLFFAIWGGSLTESGLPTTTHMHYISCTTHRVGRTAHFVVLTAHCVGRTKHHISRTAHFVGRTVHCVSRKKQERNIWSTSSSIFFLAFSRVKK